MFVKIIRGNNEVMYECERYQINPWHHKTSSGNFFITIEPCCITEEIDKTVPEHLAIYVMNNDGKTIDTIFTKVPLD